MSKQKRNTKTKQLVMNLLKDSPHALCHDDIEQGLNEQMDRVTIYRILQSFCEDGKIHKITGENGKSYYALCHCCSSQKHNDNHLHFHCIACDTISCIDKPVMEISLPKEYHIFSTSVLISGCCKNCQLPTF